MEISVCSSIPHSINKKYKTELSKDKTVTVLGSSKAVDDILDYMDLCSNITKAMVLSGKNIVHGGGSEGIMGAAYKSGLDYSAKNNKGKPVQNLAILTKSFLKNKDIDNCIPLTIAKTEGDRIEKFAQVSNNILVFPGSTGTMQEITTLISKNYYGKPEEKKNIILVGSDFFQGLIQQYHKLHESGLIKCSPNNLFTVVDTEEEIKSLLNI